MSTITQPKMIQMLYELLQEFTEHVETKLPGAGPFLPRVLIWTGAAQIAAQHSPEIAISVLKDTLQEIEAGVLEGKDPDNPSPPAYN